MSGSLATLRSLQFLLVCAYCAREEYTRLSGDSGGTCAHSDISSQFPSAVRFPPGKCHFSDVMYTSDAQADQVSAFQHQYSWTQSGKAHGNGVYTATSDNVYDIGGSDEWPASGAFDWKEAISSSRAGFHTASCCSTHLTLQMPQPVTLRYYTVESRIDCCVWKSPTTWSLYCVDSGAKVLMDSRSHQNWWGLTDDPPATCGLSVTTTQVACSSFQFEFDHDHDQDQLSLSEIAFFCEGPTPVPTVTPAPTVTFAPTVTPTVTTVPTVTTAPTPTTSWHWDPWENYYDQYNHEDEEDLVVPLMIWALVVAVVLIIAAGITV